MLISQYGNSTALHKVVDGLTSMYALDTQLESFLKDVVSLKTAKGIYLDWWGSKLGVSRDIESVDYNPDETFGFDGQGLNNFSHANFSISRNGTKYKLNDENYRSLLFWEALKLSSLCSVYEITKAMQTYFSDRGICFCSETTPMNIRYYFEFSLTQFETTFLRDNKKYYRPLGVNCDIVVIESPLEKFGFAGQGLGNFAGSNLQSAVI